MCLSCVSFKVIGETRFTRFTKRLGETTTVKKPLFCFTHTHTHIRTHTHTHRHTDTHTDTQTHTPYTCIENLTQVVNLFLITFCTPPHRLILPAIIPTRTALAPTPPISHQRLHLIQIRTAMAFTRLKVCCVHVLRRLLLIECMSYVAFYLSYACFTVAYYLSYACSTSPIAHLMRVLRRTCIR